MLLDYKPTENYIVVKVDKKCLDEMNLGVKKEYLIVEVMTDTEKYKKGQKIGINSIAMMRLEESIYLVNIKGILFEL